MLAGTVKEDLYLFPSGILVRLDWWECMPQSLSIIETRSWDLKLGLVSRIWLSWIKPVLRPEKNVYFQAAGWSCTWDLSSSHYINAGLQNGSLLVFDMHQTVGPVNSLKGLTRNPVHMADSLLHSSTLTSSVSSVLSASSICLSQWNFDGAEE
ncbi:hypothetical protein SO802_030543 [Lithocarpus litseifolius]|uniref:Uncharacterized protein n=1 Tax=Lithocarpus litseifolius TaxID=425828 RepID=A0AAW2BK70_9ROSI